MYSVSVITFIRILTGEADLIVDFMDCTAALDGFTGVLKVLESVKARRA